MSEPNRHSLYISKSVWGELKHRAFLEDMTAGGLIAYLLEWAVNHPDQVPDLERFQARSRSIGEDRARRTARGISDSIWTEAEKVAQLRGTSYSVSGLVEYLLRNYLGLNDDQENLPEESSGKNEYQPETGYLSTGRTTFDLGKDAQGIDLKPPRS